MTISHKSELMSQTWHDIKAVHDHLGRAVAQLERAERSLEGALYLDGCDLDAEPEQRPAQDNTAVGNGGSDD